MDACAKPHNAKCRHYFSPDQNALEQSWDGHIVFCNPPYDRQLHRWVVKAASARATVVLLLPASTDTAYFHDHILGRAEVRFLRGRLRFVGAESSAPFASMLVIFRHPAA